MKETTKEAAFRNWEYQSAAAAVDFLIKALCKKQDHFDKMCSDVLGHADVEQYGWLRLARMALEQSGHEAAKRMGISSSVYYRMELAARRKVISIGQMEKAAEALDCEFIYFLRPKSGLSFARIAWLQLEPGTTISRFASQEDERGQAIALASRVQDKQEVSKARQELGWNKRTRTTVKRTRV